MRHQYGNPDDLPPLKKRLNATQRLRRQNKVNRRAERRFQDTVHKAAVEKDG